MAIKNRDCFFPNGDLRIERPCFPEAAVSPCCAVDWTCLANGLCFYPPSGRLSRGTCTDPDWNSPDCPQYCTESSYIFNPFFVDFLSMS